MLARSLSSRSLLLLALGIASPLTACTAEDEAPELGAVDAALTFGSVGTFIKVSSSNLCLSGTAGANPMWVTQQACTSSASIWFVAVPAPDPAYYEIRAQGRCLDVPSSSTQPGQQLQLYPCTGNNNQQFRLTRVGSDWEIHPKLASALCLDIANGDSVPGRALQQFACHGGANQRFITRPKLLEENFDSLCPSADRLRVEWSFTWGGSSAAIDVGGGETWFENGNRARLWCGATSGSPDEQVACPTGTNTVEVSRVAPERVRVRCYL